MASTHRGPARRFRLSRSAAECSPRRWWSPTRTAQPGRRATRSSIGPSTAEQHRAFSIRQAPGWSRSPPTARPRSPFAPGNGIIYYARGATNVVEAAPTLTTPIELVGSTGGTNTLIGGAGNDTLVSVQGNDYLEGTTGNTDFVLILGHDPTLVASTGINTIDLSQTPQNVTLNLGSQTVQSVDMPATSCFCKAHSRT